MLSLNISLFMSASGNHDGMDSLHLFTWPQTLKKSAKVSQQNLSVLTNLPTLTHDFIFIQ